MDADKELNLACVIGGQGAERRMHDRVELAAPVGVRIQQQGRERGTVKNLSVSGCAIEAPGIYPTGSRIFVTIANFEPFVGQVVWQRNGQVGVLFDRPLHTAIVNHISELLKN